MSDLILIRAPQPKDVSQITEFNRLLALETEHRALDVNTLRRGVERIVNDPRLGLYFVAERGGAVVGQAMVTFEWSDWRCGFFWWLQSVYVEREQRGRGVFCALWEHIERAARAEGEVCGLRLYVERENEPAQAAYRKLGFVPSGHFVLECDWSAARRDVP